MMLSFLLPAFYMTSEGRADSFMLPLYLAGFILVIPTAIGKYTLWKVKGLMVWLLICAGLFAAVYVTAGLVSRLLPWDTVYSAARAAAGADEYASINTVVPFAYQIVSVFGTALILFDFYLVRMQEASRIRAARENDMSWKSRSFLFDTPGPHVLIWFGAVYAAGLLFHCPAVCNMAAVCFVIYAVMVFFYRYVSDTEFYLHRLDYISSMPGRRIRTIGTVMLAVFLLVLLIGVSLSGRLTSGLRQYKDLRNMKGTGLITEEDMAALSSPMPEPLFVPPDEIEPVEQWKYGFILQYLAYALLAVCGVVGLRAILGVCKEVFDEFRDIEDENGDLSVSLENGDRAERLVRIRRRRGPETERERIRREYRRAILKAKKSLPSPSGTPVEIEEEAGLLGNSDMQKLHVRYEAARYGSDEE